MRIFSVSPNYNQANNVAFGKCADENARKVVQKAADEAKSSKVNDPDMQLMYDFWVKRMEDDENFIYYTDEHSGKVKGRFDDEFVKNNSDTSIYMQRAISNRIERLKRRGNLDDLSRFGNIEDISRSLRDIQRLLKGVNLADECRSKNPRGDARPVEWEKEERIRNLAD